MRTQTETQFQHRAESIAPLARLLSARATLPAAEARVAETLLAEPEATRFESVGELGARAGASPATVVRLCQRLGFDGFLGLKLALAEEAGAARQFGHPDEDAGASSSSVLERAVPADARALAGALSAIDRARFDEATAALLSAEEVLLGGVGTSAALADLAAIRFMALGIRAIAFSDVLGQHMATGLLSEKSVALLLSHTGSSKDTVEFARTASSSGATTIGVTSFARSPLAAVVDVALVTGDSRNPESLALFANRVVHASVLGALHAAVAAALPPTRLDHRSGAVLAKHQY